LAERRAVFASARREREALRLCEELDIPLLLTDDLAAREAAVGVGATPVGSIGIIAKSQVAGMIDLSEAEWALRELQKTSSLFVSRAIVEGAILVLRLR
jgi:predicted nucleic acid-binding protein